MARQVVLQLSPFTPGNFIEVLSNGDIRVPDSVEDLIPKAMKLLVQDVEWIFRGPHEQAFLSTRVHVSIHLGVLGQGVSSFRVLAPLDAAAFAGGCHYLQAGFEVNRGDLITPGSFVFPNHGGGDLQMILRGRFLDADG